MLDIRGSQTLCISPSKARADILIYRVKITFYLPFVVEIVVSSFSLEINAQSIAPAREVWSQSLGHLIAVIRTALNVIYILEVGSAESTCWATTIFRRPSSCRCTLLSL